MSKESCEGLPPTISALQKLSLAARRSRFISVCFLDFDTSSIALMTSALSLASELLISCARV